MFSSLFYLSVLRLNGGVNVQFSNGKKRGAIFSASVGQNSSNDIEGKRFFLYSLTPTNLAS